MKSQDTDLLQAARAEDLLNSDIPKLTVLGSFETKVVETLKQSGAHLLQGARGVGKSMLMRHAEVEMDFDFPSSRKMAVYVNFKTSTLLEGVKAEKRDAFQIWIGAKILLSIYEKLIALDLVGHSAVQDPYYKVFGIKTSQGIQSELQEKIHLLQKLAMTSNKEEAISKIGDSFLDKVNDVTFLLEMINEIIEAFKIDKLILLFDEAAHTFIPSQQEIFFEIFKLLHGGKIAVKAAVYPTVTSYGHNFEIGQDAIVIPMDRFETGLAGRQTNRQLFRDMLSRRVPKTGQLTKMLFSKGYLLDQCIDLSTGNPRAFFHLLIRTIDKGYSDRAVLLSTQEFVDQELIPYHLNLSKRLPKYGNHVRQGFDMLRGYIIPELRNKNFRTKLSNYQSAYFTIQRDMSPNLKLALDILCYSGILSSQGTVKIAERKTGLRYMIHIALLYTEKAFSSKNISDAIKALSLTDYREFSSSDKLIEVYIDRLKDTSDKCPDCSADIDPQAKFCAQCGTRITIKSIIGPLLDEPVSALSISDKLKARVQPQFPKVGDVIQATRNEIMKIKWIKEVRSRIIKNAADEFISG
jgi:hypothetical protein